MSAAAKVAEIEHRLKEVLIRLPTKALLKFKCIQTMAPLGFLMPTAILIDDSLYYASKVQVIPLNSEVTLLPKIVSMFL